MASWEWLIFLVLALGLGVAELISVRRSIRRAKDAEKRASGHGP